MGEVRIAIVANVVIALNVDSALVPNTRAVNTKPYNFNFCPRTFLESEVRVVDVMPNRITKLPESA